MPGSGIEQRRDQPRRELAIVSSERMICRPARPPDFLERGLRFVRLGITAAAGIREPAQQLVQAVMRARERRGLSSAAKAQDVRIEEEIGRASCRERGWPYV